MRDPCALNHPNSLQLRAASHSSSNTSNPPDAYVERRPVKAVKKPTNPSRPIPPRWAA
jgi:hypothetical protein